MPSLAVCRCIFRLMRRCFLGRWICLTVSERFRLVWKCHLFEYSTYIQFCVHWIGGQCLRRLVPNYEQNIYVYIYIYIYVKLGTLIEGDSMVPFSIATRPIYRGGCYSIPQIAPIYPRSLSYNAEYYAFFNHWHGSTWDYAHVCVYMLSLGWVLWHINCRRLFNTKFCFCV